MGCSFFNVFIPGSPSGIYIYIYKFCVYHFMIFCCCWYFVFFYYWHFEVVKLDISLHFRVIFCFCCLFYQGVWLTHLNFFLSFNNFTNVNQIQVKLQRTRKASFVLSRMKAKLAFSRPMQCRLAEPASHQPVTVWMKANLEVSGPLLNTLIRS